MNPRGHGKFRYAAVAVLVVLALTGFSTGKGRGHGSGDGGGGCSSSGQDHDGSSSSGGVSGSRYHDYDDDDDTSGGGGSGDTSTAPVRDAEAYLVSCATRKAPYATVSVSNPNGTAATFSFEVEFLDDQADTVFHKSMTAYVPANASTDVRVKVDDTSLFSRIDHCRVDQDAPPVS
ncbi:hypothetical protein ACIBVL_23280 [Streptomyces sp. NPDC049687]|uniref:hypothetical protein n=1 Tax=Streptomyces sp. NPDC049687 TaxID=3365596 RepID=UPI00379052B0